LLGGVDFGDAARFRAAAEQTGQVFSEHASSLLGGG